MYICLCKGLTESDVQRIGQVGIVEAEKLVEVLGLNDDDCCGRCACDIQEFVALATCKIDLRCPNSAQCRYLFDSYLKPS